MRNVKCAFVFFSFSPVRCGCSQGPVCGCDHLDFNEDEGEDHGLIDALRNQKG